MSAKDAEVTEEDRQAAIDAIIGVEFDSAPMLYCVEKKVTQVLANYRRDAYRAGQIAGLEEADIIVRSTRKWAVWRRFRAAIDDRIRELKGET